MTAGRDKSASPVAAAVVREAVSWIGTPYRHQASRRGVGCDCLGLVRGVWQVVCGFDLEPPVAAYSLDWAEAGGGEELLAGARRHFCEKRAADAQAGDLLLFRWRPHLPAKHAGILIAHNRFVHAYQGGGAVVASSLVPQWRRRIAAVFAFPDFTVSPT
ncbi:MAG: NlpC/P60 family protein [Mesorhizobium sp.]